MTYLNLDFSSENGENDIINESPQQVAWHRPEAQQMAVSQHTSVFTRLT